jgi:selenide,water dikinase
LDNITKNLAIPNDDKLLVGLNNADDASVYKLKDDLAIVNTVDFFTPVVDDPYLYGQISAANSISDIYAMGGRPFTALNILGFHQGQVSEEIVAEILRGGFDKAKEAGCVIAGGHSIQDNELKYGLAVSGTIHPDKIWQKKGMQAGDKLILTKPLGCGAISTALKQEKASQTAVDEIVESMTLLNKIPAEILIDRQFDVHSCTDISGFGLAVHLLEMIGDHHITAQIQIKDIPLFNSAKNYLFNPSYLPGGFYNNRKFSETKVGPHIEKIELNPLFDPQTSGGLLFALSPKETERFMEQIQQTVYPYPCWIIGRVTDGNEYKIEVKR